MNKANSAQITIGQLSDIKCPCCGRFYPLSDLKAYAWGEYPPMCIRCALNTPVLKEVAKVIENQQTLEAVIEEWDVAYEKALEHKRGNKIQKPTFAALSRS